MKKINQSGAGTRALDKSLGQEKEVAHNNNANSNENSAKHSTPGEIKQSRNNNDEDDLMKRNDFRYFYSGRKLL